MASHFDDDELLSLATPAQSRVPARPAPQKLSQAQASPKGTRAIDESTAGGRAEQRYGQYILKRTLGEGSFGKVKLAVHRITGQEVALKIISRKKLISKDMAGRVEREIAYLQLLRHPHIIKLYTVIQTKAEIIMVLEYAGGELFDYLVKHGKMAEEKARRFFQQIVCAVEYCHRHKIVHRDLKPENLLLDSALNVKIADFGLSNIMTDGNFLKTSCGSPNYAAPEVISGKLYAGPEVDVWSCGIILYVLLCGRLPFDDDFIPALFRKINSGTYHTPSYLSSGAKNLIHKMLKVNPVQRITIQEVRQDAWFNEGLEDYLKPPVEEFIDTGIDPNKAIDPRRLAPGKPRELQERIHETAVGKLGQTMGYAKDDIKEALAKDEPSAIKDAYLIVMENQIMQTIPSLRTPNNIQPYLATSPPPAGWNPEVPASPVNMTPLSRAVEKRPERQASPPTASPSPATGPGLGAAHSTEPKADTYVSKVSILASSLPYYHNQFMEQQKKEKREREALAAKQQQQGGGASEGEDLEPHEAEYFSKLSLGAGQKVPTPDQQAEMARRLKPHSRSTIQLQHIVSQPMNQSDEAVKTEKKKMPRWQFGIRSRNLPHEAMHCVFKALVAQGAQWEVPAPSDDEEEAPFKAPKTYPVNVKGSTDVDASVEQSRPPSPEQARTGSKEAAQPGYLKFEKKPMPKMQKRMVPKPGGDGYETDDADIDPTITPPNYIPKDPWCIRVRWRKDGMYPPSTTVHPSSAHSSSANLQDTNRLSLTSSVGSSTSAMAPPPSGPSADGSCYVYMDVQLYSLEPGPDRQPVYLVDFKCAGYESIVEKVVSDTEKLLVGSGYRVRDKDVTSPQPFLDLANKLVIHLAAGGG